MAGSSYDVFIVHHGWRQNMRVDCMKKIALDIRDMLQQPPAVPTFVDEADLAPAANARYCMDQNLLDCELAIVLFCNDFFDSTFCSDEAKVVLEESGNGRFRYLPVFFTATPKDVERMAEQAWGKDMSTQLVTTAGIRHKGEMHDGIQVSRRTTIQRICQEVRKLCEPELQGVVQGPAPAVIATAMADAGGGAASKVPVLVATATSTVVTAQQAVAGPVLTVWEGTGLAASASPAVCLMVAVAPLAVQPGPSCVFTATSSSLLTPKAVAVITTAMAVVLGYSRIAARPGCVTAVAQVLPNSCSPQQMLGWAQQLSQQITAAESAKQGWPAVVAASGAGGLVAWCQQGWGVYLNPFAPGLPRLGLTHSRVLPVHSDCCSSHASPAALGISWHGEKGPSPALLVNTGPELHAVHLPCTDALATSAAMSSGLADIVADMFPDEGLLLLSAATGQFYSSTPEAVLVLDVDRPTATHLNNMVAQGGSLVLHWLHTLLLQPDSQLSLFGNGTQSVGGNESNGRWDSSIIESILAAGAGEFDTKGLQQLQQQLLEPGSDLSVIMSNDLKTWLPANPQPKGANQTGSTASEAAAGAAAVSDNMLSVRLAAVRARAAYALLVVAVKQKQPLVVRWLLARLRQQRSWLGQGHCTAEAVLVAQQRIAWSGMLPGFHPPLLALATAVGNKLIAEELRNWSAYHNLPTSVHLEIQRAAQTLLAARWASLGLGCLDKLPPQALDAGEWLAVDSAPNILLADSLEELESVLGPEGDLSVAVLGGDIKCVQGVLDSGDCSQQQLDEALELAAMLCRVEILQLLLVHGADPGARGAAALTWAVQRRGEPQKCWALLDKITPRRRRRSSSSISSSAGHLAVAVWCRGLQDELSGLRDSTAPQPQLQSLQQFLRDAKPGQRTVANLLTQLHQEWPELFAARQSSRVKFSIEDVWASPAGTAPPQNQVAPRSLYKNLLVSLYSLTDVLITVAGLCGLGGVVYGGLQATGMDLYTASTLVLAPIMLGTALVVTFVSRVAVEDLENIKSYRLETYEAHKDLENKTNTTLQQQPAEAYDLLADKAGLAAREETLQRQQEEQQSPPQ